MTDDSAADKHDAIDRYRLTRVHSEGGLGRVWLASDPEIGREVALKELLSKEAADPRARALFLREARITGQLEHPNIVPVYEIGEHGDDGRPFYTMRFVRGATLSAAIREDFAQRKDARAWPRDRQRLLRALCSVCGAIAHAHSRGIVHRDLKPDNIIIGQFGELILLDWGLAKRLDDDTPQDSFEIDIEPSDEPDILNTHAGSVMGTIAYMSPEQADGRPTNEHTDIYGLGAVLFEILTGQPPHQGEDAVGVLREIIKGPSPRARAINPATPVSLDTICAKAMARRATDRFSHANELVEELERWLADEPVTCHPDNQIRALTRWVRHHQSWAYAGTIALLVIVIISTLTAISLGAAAERERGMRERSIRASAKLAARAVANEIDLRWHVLQAAATEIRLHDALDHGDDAALQDWIVGQAERHQHLTPTKSWIIQDRTGIQRARAPYNEISIGENYGFRDYFHGRGEDFANRSEPRPAIREVHRSIVFRSEVTKNLMVAFSVPIWSFAPSAPEVIGVLGMTVELGQFGVLQLGLDHNPVLVDTKLDANRRRGQILQHAEIAERRDRRSRDGTTPIPPYYISPHRVEQLSALRAAALERFRSRDGREGRLPVIEADLEGSFDSAYEDRVGGKYRGRWLAAFEPVFVNSGDGEVADTGWVVIRQERDQAP